MFVITGPPARWTTDWLRATPVFIPAGYHRCEREDDGFRCMSVMSHRKKGRALCDRHGGGPGKGWRYAKITEARIKKGQEVAELVTSGMTVKAAAETLGYPESTARGALDAYWAHERQR